MSTELPVEFPTLITLACGKYIFTDSRHKGYENLLLIANKLKDFGYKSHEDILQKQINSMGHVNISFHDAKNYCALEVTVIPSYGPYALEDLLVYVLADFRRVGFEVNYLASSQFWNKVEDLLK